MTVNWNRSPGRCSNLSAARKRQWADPAFRERMSEIMKAAMSRPEVREKISLANKAATADPTARALMSAAMKAALADPAKGPRHLRGLSVEQRETYRLYRAKGFSVGEALAAVRV